MVGEEGGEGRIGGEREKYSGVRDRMERREIEGE